MRSSFRDWATEVENVEYATAERCLAHAVGSDAALNMAAVHKTTHLEQLKAKSLEGAMLI